jgi:transcriptional regulator with XRE-family HTH domain
MPQTRPLDPGESLAACLGAVLRRLRAIRRLSQDELGRLAGYDGSYVGAVERAAVRPPRELLERCDRALDGAGALVGLWRFADQEWELRASLGAAPRPTGPAGGDGAASPGGDAWPDPVVEALELARRVEASDVGEGAVAGVEQAVGRLRRAATGTPPAALVPTVRTQLGYVGRLLEGRLTVAQRRRLLVAAGWLSLLLARLRFDNGEREAAEANRDAAQRLARQAGHAELAAWTLEALAWWALVDGRFAEALELARAGQDQAPPASAAAVQLALHEAQAWTQLGEREEAAGAIRQAELCRAMLPGRPPPGLRVPID